jgi:oligopeptide transport system permease protein
MKLILQLTKTFLIWLFIVTILVLLVLFPRRITFGFVEGSAEMRREYHFSWEEYRNSVTNYIKKVWENKSLGESRFGLTVEEEMKRYFPRSLKLIIPAFILSVLLGILKGVYDYRTQRGKRVILGNGTTWLFQSLPDFMVIMGFQYVAILLMRMISIKIPIYSFPNWYELIVPILLLSIYPTMHIARITSASLAEQEGMYYLMTAKGKGLSEMVVLYKHALKNCLGTIFSHFSTIMLYILSNLLIIEYLMFYKGAAYRLYEAFGFNISNRRTTFYAGESRVFESELIIGFIFAFMLIVLITQVASQVVKHRIDPR